MTDNAKTDDAMTDDAMTDDAMTDDAMTDDAMTESTARDVASARDPRTGDAPSDDDAPGEPDPHAHPPLLGPADAPRTRQGRATLVMQLLDEYIPAPAIPLDHGDAFQLLVAVILSAQCTDARVNMVTPALFARAPTAAAMAKLTAAQIMPYIRTCGLAPGKAKALAKTSRMLVKQHGGEVPRDLAALEKLPGVGHKTASVVMVQAFGEPAFPVDTHIHRLAGRWQLSRARSVEEVEADLKALFPRERWHDLHLQMIYFGRAYCTAKGHVRARCPICCWAMSAAREKAELRQGLSKPVAPRRAGDARRAPQAVKGRRRATRAPQAAKGRRRATRAPQAAKGRRRATRAGAASGRRR